MGHPLSPPQLQAAFASIDSSGDGRISYDEFRRWWANAERFAAFEMSDQQPTDAAAEQQAQWLQQVTDHFKYFDQDRSGSISRQEFTTLYKHLVQSGYHLPQSEVAARAQLDANGDGSISLAEYVAWMRTASR